MRYLCIALFIIGAALMAFGAAAKAKSQCAEQRGLAGIFIGIGVVIEVIDAVIFIIWKLVT